MTSILQSSKSENGKAHFEMVVRRETDGKKQKVTLPDVTFDVKTDEESGRTYLVYVSFCWAWNRGLVIPLFRRPNPSARWR